MTLPPLPAGERAGVRGRGLRRHIHGAKQKALTTVASVSIALRPAPHPNPLPGGERGLWRDQLFFFSAAFIFFSISSFRHCWN